MYSHHTSKRSFELTNKGQSLPSEVYDSLDSIFNTPLKEDSRLSSQGSLSTVYKLMLRKLTPHHVPGRMIPIFEEEPVVLKIGEADGVYSSENAETLLKEIEAVRELNHPNIVDYLAYQNDTSEPKLLMRFVDQGSDLYDFIVGFEDKNIRLPLMLSIEISIKILDALLYLHTSRCMTHGDIKAENILIQYDERTQGVITLKLCDFSFSRSINDVNTLVVVSDIGGTPRYLPYEIICNYVGAQSDVFAFAQVFSVLSSFAIPFKSFSDSALDNLFSWININFPDFSTWNEDTIYNTMISSRRFSTQQINDVFSGNISVSKGLSVPAWVNNLYMHMSAFIASKRFTVAQVIQYLEFIKQEALKYPALDRQGFLESVTLLPVRFFTAEALKTTACEIEETTTPGINA